MRDEQNLLKKRMDDLSNILQNEKQKVFEKKVIKNTSLSKKFSIFKKNSICFVKSKFIRDPNITCHFCCQHGHLQRDCYVKKNIKLGIKAMWIEKESTNPLGPKKVWVPKSIS